VLIPRVAKVLGSARVSVLVSASRRNSLFQTSPSSTEESPHKKSVIAKTRSLPQARDETHVLPKIPRLDKAIGYNRSLITSH
jgi:hypothetical protein